MVFLSLFGTIVVDSRTGLSRFRTIRMWVCPGKLGAEQKDLRSEIDPCPLKSSDAHFQVTLRENNCLSAPSCPVAWGKGRTHTINCFPAVLYYSTERAWFTLVQDYFHSIILPPLCILNPRTPDRWQFWLHRHTTCPQGHLFQRQLSARYVRFCEFSRQRGRVWARP